MPRHRMKSKSRTFKVANPCILLIHTCFFSTVFISLSVLHVHNYLKSHVANDYFGLITTLFLCWASFLSITELTLGLSIGSIDGDILSARSIMKKRSIPLDSIIEVRPWSRCFNIIAIDVCYIENNKISHVYFPMESFRVLRITKKYIESRSTDKNGHSKVPRIYPG